MLGAAGAVRRWRRVGELDKRYDVPANATEDSTLALAIHPQAKGALGHVELEPHPITGLDPFHQHQLWRLGWIGLDWVGLGWVGMGVGLGEAEVGG